MNTLIVIVGPTAIGKTAMAIEIAKQLNTEIISADSRQFFRETEIGTAKPSEDELNSVPHHFINSHSIQDFFSTGDFEQAALKKITQLFEKHAQAVMVGGSGLYINAVCDGLDDLPEIDLKIRAKITEEFENHGIEYLQNKLQNIDKEIFSKIDIYNPQRMIRAIEVYESTGKPLSHYQTQSKKERPFQILKIGLNTDRAELYQKINLRVDQMMQMGLLQEVEKLFSFKGVNALKTVGYSEIFEHLEGEIDLATAVEKIKQNTRRFAKRQLTWFRKDSQIQWFEPQDFEAIWAYIQSQM